MTARIPVSDYLLAGLAALVTALAAWLVTDLGWTWSTALNLVAHAGLTAALLVRHVWPRTSFVVTYSLLAALAALAWWAPVSLGVSPLVVCAALSLYVMARHESTAWGVAALLLGVAGAFVSPLRRLPDAAAANASIPLSVLILIGTFLWASGRRRAELAYLQQLADQHAEQERLTVSQVAQARTEERLLLARDLHDVVAHALTVIRVQAGTASAVGTPEAMREALAHVQQASRDALGDLRSLVSALREDHGRGVTADLDQVSALVDQARAAGLTVAAALPPAAELERWQARWPAASRLAVLRVVQEGLTNVIKHAAASTRTTVSLTATETTAKVEIFNDDEGRPGPGITRGGPAAARGFGLVGLAERVHLAGGEVTAGRHDGGFRLVATIPIPQDRR